MANSLKDAYTVNIQIEAGGFKSYPASGRFVRCLNSNGDFQISLNHGSKAYFDAGMSRRLPIEDADYETVQVYNPNGFDLEVTLAIGFGDIEDDRLSISNQSISTEEVPARSLDSFNAVSVIDQAAATAILAQNLNRKSVILKNLSSMGAVWIGDSDVSGAGRGYPLNPNGEIELHTTAAIYAHNTSGIDCDVSILEVVK